MTISKAEPTIVDFMDVVGQHTSNVSRKNVGQYTNRTMVRLSVEWSKVVSTQRRIAPYGDKPKHLDKELDQDLSILNPECARLEVEAISVLASLETPNKKSRTTIDMHEEDDDFLAEIANLEESTRSLQAELERVERNPSWSQVEESFDQPASLNKGDISLIPVPQFFYSFQFLSLLCLIRTSLAHTYRDPRDVSYYNDNTKGKYSEIQAQDICLEKVSENTSQRRVLAARSA